MTSEIEYRDTGGIQEQKISSILKDRHWVLILLDKEKNISIYKKIMVRDKLECICYEVTLETFRKDEESEYNSYVFKDKGKARKKFNELLKIK